eukprot:7229501-Prymnesium_polylepis.2
MRQAGQFIARGQPCFSDVQASASEAQVERRYDPKSVRAHRAWLAKVCEGRGESARKRGPRGNFLPQSCESCESVAAGAPVLGPGRPKAAKVTHLSKHHYPCDHNDNDR